MRKIKSSATPWIVLCAFAIGAVLLGNNYISNSPASPLLEWSFILGLAIFGVLSVVLTRIQSVAGIDAEYLFLPPLEIARLSMFRDHLEQKIRLSDIAIVVVGHSYQFSSSKLSTLDQITRDHIHTYMKDLFEKSLISKVAIGTAEGAVLGVIQNKSIVANAATGVAMGAAVAALTDAVLVVKKNGELVLAPLQAGTSKPIIDLVNALKDVGALVEDLINGPEEKRNDSPLRIIMIVVALITGIVVFFAIIYFTIERPQLAAIEEENKNELERRDQRIQGVYLSDIVPSALFAYRSNSKNDVYPRSLSELVPQYMLKEDLIDPVTKESFIYTTDATRKTYRICLAGATSSGCVTSETNLLHVDR